MASTEVKTYAKFGLLNVHSIKNKADHFKDFVTENEFDIMALTETWLKPDDDYTLSDIYPQGYSIKHVPRITLTWGGGVAIVHRSSVSIIMKSAEKYTSFELIEVVLTSAAKCYRVAVIYRPLN